MLLLHLRCETDLTPLGVCSFINIAVAAALTAVACIVLICHQSLYCVKHVILLIIAANAPITQVESIKLWLLDVKSGLIERVIFVLLSRLERREQVIITAIKVVGDAYSAPPRTCSASGAWKILLASEFFQPIEPLIEFIGRILLYYFSRVIRAFSKFIRSTILVTVKVAALPAMRLKALNLLKCLCFDSLHLHTSPLNKFCLLCIVKIPDPRQIILL